MQPFSKGTMSAPPKIAAEAEAVRAEDEDQQARVDEALQDGWVFRHDPVRGEFTAARELRTARTLEGLLAAIGEAGR